MSSNRIRLLAVAAGALGLVGAASAQTGDDCLTTLLGGDNQGSNGGTVYFDLDIGSSDLTFTDIALNTDASVGANVDIIVFITAPGGTHVGNELNPGAWTQVATGSGAAAGVEQLTLIPLDSSFVLNAGAQYGVAINLFHDGVGAGHRYTNGTGSNEVHTNADLEFVGGSATNGLFGPSPFSPRVFNGRLFYNGGIAGCELPACTGTEIFSMTVPSSQIEMDDLEVGAVTVAELNAAGTPGPADLRDVTLPDKPTSTAGVYDTNNFLGKALARVGGTIEIIPGDPATPAFDPVTYDITFNSPHTEFGFEIGDWNGPVIVTLYDGTEQLAQVTTGSTATVPQFVQISSGCEFNRATIDVSTAGGNFVVTQLWTGEGDGACYADCDGTGSLDFFDFLCFQNEFAAQTAYADCDGTGQLDFFDFLCFQNEFAAGCR